MAIYLGMSLLSVVRRKQQLHTSITKLFFKYILLYILSNTTFTNCKSLIDSNSTSIQNTEAKVNELSHSIEINVYGNLHTDGYYYIFANIGTPPQPQMLIIDTGSLLLTVASANCAHCGKHGLSNVDPSQSNSSQCLKYENPKCKSIQGGSNYDGKCVFKQSYYEGSVVKGEFLQDVIELKGNNTNKLKFKYEYIALVNEEHSLMYSQQANGIFPLGCNKSGLKSGNIDKECTLLYALLGNNINVGTQMFALCLSDNGGILEIGGYNSRYLLKNEYHSETISWMPIVNAPIYAIHIDYLEISGKPFAATNKTFLLDSGSTVTSLEPGLYDPLVAWFNKACGDLNRGANFIAEFAMLRGKTNTMGIPNCIHNVKEKKYCFSSHIILSSLYLLGYVFT
ncbi:bifunctional Peptidase family A1 domain/Aspartic peptidase domain superfamily/Xylanase inhibitor [Babesia duncani]|uniref:Bifunctional Peptidase family A1 domain/Aspartic peptidase domain superfamily/Xylanase inhibitor n=1 Tax=Babesia duncani TaxID=323732 RepID=A0AAD9UNK1_9APIC|nr:bifunctional Peptidase family A1 domain/Aspartic peptidase domain superfamily/Xylanase inhibitor [Babesia duncani]